MRSRLLLAMLLIPALFVSCDNGEGKEGTKTVSLAVEVKAKEGIELPEDIVFDVKVVNYDTKFEETKETDAEGKVAFSGLIPGRYSITATKEQVVSGKSNIYTGSLSNVNVLKDESLTLDVDVSSTNMLVIKELYYNACRTASNGVYMKDQFYEIYNNGDETLYVDGLCFGHLMPEQATGKANYIWDTPNPESYVFFARIMQIPGTSGTTTNYPLAPGESVVFCQWAVNHQRETLNPLSPVDLSSAEFEWYEPTNDKQTDEPAVNLTMAFPINPSSPYKIWTTTANGPAYAIFFPEEDFSVEKVATDINNKVSQSYPIPIDIILDAVETVKDGTQVANKRVPTVLDSGQIWVVNDDGEPQLQVGKSVVRKVKETRDDGRVVLQDTNNTTQDFELKKAEIRRYGAKAPAWNTWAN